MLLGASGLVAGIRVARRSTLVHSRCTAVRNVTEGGVVGINRWSGGTEDRKRKEKDAKAGEKLAEGGKGDESSRLEASEEPTADPEKRRVVEKLEQQERDPS